MRKIPFVQLLSADAANEFPATLKTLITTRMTSAAISIFRFLLKYRFISFS
jgi:hypothetical protein